MLVEQERKVSQMHNMSLMSHLSFDPAAVAHLDVSHLMENSQLKMSDDRAQIISWHLNQI